MQRIEPRKRKKILVSYLLDVFIPVDSDRERFPNVQRELVGISQFFSDFYFNSRVVTLLLLFRNIKSVIIDVIKILLYVQWPVLSRASSTLSFSLAVHEAAPYNKSYTI
jgi:hypothetical protein